MVIANLTHFLAVITASQFRAPCRRSLNSSCYRYALHQKAVHLALTAPQTQAQLEENLSVLHAPELTAEAVVRWQEYGALVYGNGQDAFETKWL